MSGAAAATLRQRRTAARLAAVQTLYEMEVADAAPEVVLRDLHQRNLPSVDNGENGQFAEPDGDFMEKLVRGVVARRDEIDRHIAAVLKGRLALDRLEVLLRAILRCGACELLAMPDIPAKVVITEYLGLAHAFFAGKEPPLVNAVLDRLSARLRTSDDGA